MNCETFQVYFTRLPTGGVQLRIWVDGDTPIYDVVVPCWAQAFRVAIRRLVRGLLQAGEPV